MLTQDEITIRLGLVGVGEVDTLVRDSGVTTAESRQRTASYLLKI